MEKKIEGQTVCGGHIWFFQQDLHSSSRYSFFTQKRHTMEFDVAPTGRCAAQWHYSNRYGLQNN
jgi:hypothetical protein